MTLMLIKFALAMGILLFCLHLCFAAFGGATIMPKLLKSKQTGRAIKWCITAPFRLFWWSAKTVFNGFALAIRALRA